MFRKRALKTHPDKGGDPVEFKKINDAYNRLIGHILKVIIYRFNHSDLNSYKNLASTIDTVPTYPYQTTYLLVWTRIA